MSAGDRNVACAHDHPGPVAPWRQIHADLLRKIDGGELPPGSRVPSIVAQAQEYKVALTTVREALNLLKSEGLIVGVAGYGTFVAGG